MINLLAHERTEETAYVALRDTNFTNSFERWLNSGLNSSMSSDMEVYLIHLFRKYVEVDQRVEGNTVSHMLLRQIKEWIQTQVLFSAPASRNGDSSLRPSDEALEICYLLLPYSEGLDFILHRSDLYGSCSFVKLLEEWSYKHDELTLNCFTNDELEILLERITVNACHAWGG